MERSADRYTLQGVTRLVVKEYRIRIHGI
jgi:hypothetical protein